MTLGGDGGQACGRGGGIWRSRLTAISIAYIKSIQFRYNVYRAVTLGSMRTFLGKIINAIGLKLCVKRGI